MPRPNVLAAKWTTELVSARGGEETSVECREISAEFEHLLNELRRQHSTEIFVLQSLLKSQQVDGDVPGPMASDDVMGKGCERCAELDQDDQASPVVGRISMVSELEEMNPMPTEFTDPVSASRKRMGVIMATRISAIYHEKINSFRKEVFGEVDLEAATPWEKINVFVQSNVFEGIIVSLLLVNVAFMAVQLQVEGSQTGYDLGVYSTGMDPKRLSGFLAGLSVVDDVFTVLFMIDLLLRIVVLRARFWMSASNYIDFVVVAASAIYMAVRSELFMSPIIIRLLRMSKLLRASRMVMLSRTLDSLKILVRALQSSVGMLFWSFCLLVFIQVLAGMCVSNLARGFLESPWKSEAELDVRKQVFQFYGTFTRTILTMFEVLFANWAPACRILVDSVNEWFAVFFIVYRCIVCFAVLNVVNAVFVQQTMKVAQSDDESCFKTRLREHVAWFKKVKDIFNEADTSGDGMLERREFLGLLTSQRLKLWMSQLQLEYHDLAILWDLLDDGDGLISLDEFAEGAERLRGYAKSIDLYRVERKLEDLIKGLRRLTNLPWKKE
eukprot:TRINITY_DN88675_c0_g1_i1.p1 TRINITY_DN88675_c0_g1~~TRINITY_DN88675_c0_g1_i1.p1  ORF type:complete len:555 (-),score=99.94 TRINITY_DN88675_c0_g1_i1:5-1669(-)